MLRKLDQKLTEAAKMFCLTEMVSMYYWWHFASKQVTELVYRNLLNLVAIARRRETKIFHGATWKQNKIKNILEF